MAEEEQQTVQLRNDFYRDGFYKVLTILLMLLVAIALLISVASYLFMTTPPPVSFSTDNEWRVVQPVPVSVPYLETADLLQWTSDAVSTVFTVDFVNYMKEIKSYTPYFTTQGWQKFMEQINLYASFNNVQGQKLFITGSPTGAPYILKQGLLADRYAWWVQMPIQLIYASAGGATRQRFNTQILVVRISTLNNLHGVAIENMIITPEAKTKGGP